MPWLVAALPSSSEIGFQPPHVSWVSYVAMRLYFRVCGSTRHCLMVCTEWRRWLTAYFMVLGSGGKIGSVFLCDLGQIPSPF